MSVHIERLSIFSPMFLLKYAKNNIEYLIQNMIRHVIQIYYYMLELIS